MKKRISIYFLLFLCVNFLFAESFYKQPEEITISYFSEQSKSPNSITIIKNSTLSIDQLPPLHSSGFIFKGWYYCNKKVKADVTIFNTSSILYAKWKVKKNMDILDILYKLSGIVAAFAALFAVFVTLRISKKQNSLTKSISERQDEITKSVAEQQNSVNKEIAAKQLQQAKLENNINLYDKRFTIYKCFCKKYPITNWFENSVSSSMQEYLLGLIYSSDDEAKDSINKELKTLSHDVNNKMMQDTIEMADKLGTAPVLVAEMKKKNDRYEELKNRIDRIDCDYRESQLNIINMSEFCYPEEISSCIIEYFKYIYSFDVYKNKALDEKKMKDFKLKIEELDIISKMKKLLKLSFDDID